MLVGDRLSQWSEVSDVECRCDIPPVPVCVKTNSVITADIIQMINHNHEYTRGDGHFDWSSHCFISPQGMFHYLFNKDFCTILSLFAIEDPTKTHSHTLFRFWIYELMWRPQFGIGCTSSFEKYNLRHTICLNLTKLHLCFPTGRGHERVQYGSSSALWNSCTHPPMVLA